MFLTTREWPFIDDGKNRVDVAAIWMRKLTRLHRCHPLHLHRRFKTVAAPKPRNFAVTRLRIQRFVEDMQDMCRTSNGEDSDVYRIRTVI